MATRTVVTLTCDLEKPEAEVEAAQTIAFGYGAVAYEIDVCPKHADKVGKDLSELAGRARKVGSAAAIGTRGQGKKAVSRGRASRERSQEIRAWAKEAGIKVSDRGRIPESVEAEYDTAHQ